LARRWGFQLYNRDVMWLDEAAFWDTWKQFEPGKTERPDRKFVVWSFAKSVAHLEGDTAECGVYMGASSYLMCHAMAGGPKRTHFVFDSFEGLSEPDAEDTPFTETAKRWKKGDLSVSEEDVRRNLAQFDNIEYLKGWIPDRFPEVADRRFVFVHIDVDLYQPTYDSIAFFFDKLVPGGVLLCDDYGSHWCAGARKAFDEFLADRGEPPVVHLPTIQGFIIKR
jgi:hypothetical protein